MFANLITLASFIYVPTHRLTNVILMLRIDNDGVRVCGLSGRSGVALQAQSDIFCSDLGVYARNHAYAVQPREYSATRMNAASTYLFRGPRAGCTANDVQPTTTNYRPRRVILP